MWSTVVLVSILGCVAAGPAVSNSRDSIEDFKAFLEKSRTDNGIRLESRMLANPKASPWENSGKFQGDILLNDEQAEALLQQHAEGRNAYIVANTKWPSNTIVYEFNNEFTQAQINAVYAAMREIQQRTCIRFRRREWWENSPFVRITGRADGCYANVGYWAPMGIHTLNLARDTPGRGCFTHTVIIHEWLHVVGFMHMQSTHNRYDYVRILWQNIWPGMGHNFDRYGTNIVNNMGLPYEYASNMHYGRYGFSVNGQATMLPLWNDNGLMGQQHFVSGWDWLRANRHYNCPGAWSAAAEEQAKEEHAQQEKLLLEQLRFQKEQTLQESPQDVQTLPESAIDENILLELPQGEHILHESPQDEQTQME